MYPGNGGRFHRGPQGKPYKGQPLTVYVSPDTAKEAERLGKDYGAVLGKLLDKAVKAYQEAL